MEMGGKGTEGGGGKGEYKEMEVGRQWEMRLPLWLTVGWSVPLVGWRGSIQRVGAKRKRIELAQVK